MKILIVDDDPVSRSILANILSAQAECQTAVAEDGESAWALLDDPGRSFDVVFLDLSMPRIDGFELLRRIRNSPLLKSIEVILCTGANDRATVARAVQLNVRHYVIKPCNAAVVLGKLRMLEPAKTDPGDRTLAGY